jgi:DNA-binding beta-propeller fold protein YncE
MRVRTTLPVLAAIAALGCTASTAGAVTVEEVGDGGLRSPRHLDFAPSGNLYVAEAGRGGPGPCFFGGEGPACMGATGAVSKIDTRGRQTRIVDGLASYANDTDGDGTLEAGEADSGIGPHGIIALSDHGVFLTSGGPTAPRTAPPPGGELLSRRDLAEQNPAARSFGRLLWILGRGHVVPVADVYRHERRNDPDGNGVDSNATDVLYDKGRFVIADAGANDVVTAFGPLVRTLSVFPNTPGVPHPFIPGATVDMQAVPTAIVEGPDGAYYMSQLTGFPFPIGGAKIFRINPRTGAYTTFASGFTMIMDLAFDKHGTLYVLEIDSNSILFPPPNGAIHAITKKGARSVVVPPDGTLTEPGGITVGKDGALYVTNFARSPDGGQVLKIRR